MFARTPNRTTKPILKAKVVVEGATDEEEMKAAQNGEAVEETTSEENVGTNEMTGEMIAGMTAEMTAGMIEMGEAAVEVEVKEGAVVEKVEALLKSKKRILRLNRSLKGKFNRRKTLHPLPPTHLRKILLRSSVRNEWPPVIRF